MVVVVVVVVVGGGVGDQHQAPAALPPPRNGPCTYRTGGCVGPWAGLDWCEKTSLHPGIDSRTVQRVASHYRVQTYHFNIKYIFKLTVLPSRHKITKIIQLLLLGINGIKITPGSTDYVQNRIIIFCVLSEDIRHSKRSRLTHLQSITPLFLCTFVLRATCQMITIYSSYIVL